MKTSYLLGFQSCSSFPFTGLRNKNSIPTYSLGQTLHSTFQLTARFPQLSHPPQKLAAIRESIDQLLEGARGETNEGRQRPLKRLIRVSELMSTVQQQELGSLLWEHTNVNDLPDLIDVYSFAYLDILAPTSIDAPSKIKKYLLTLVPRRSFSSSSTITQVSFDLLPSDTMLYEVSHSTKQFIHIPHEFDGKIVWTKEEAELLWERVLDWWENDKNALIIEGPSKSWNAD